MFHVWPHAGVAMMVAVILFWMGRNVYTYVLPTESPMTRVVRVVIAAVKNRWVGENQKV
jgi:peptide/histidine transporter 3/4